MNDKQRSKSYLIRALYFWKEKMEMVKYHLMLKVIQRLFLLCKILQGREQLEIGNV